MSKYIYGIDFGTTNSALSILDTESRTIVKTFSEASILFFIQPADSRDILSYVGKSAIDAYLENRQAGRFMKSVKRVLPRTSFVDTMVYTQKYTAADLVTLILKCLKDKADAFTGHNVEEIILGRPVFFDENPTKDKLAQTRLHKAATNAGFSSITFQMEPIAAAFAYEQTLTTDETVLVADIGGGTSDFTIMKLGPERFTKANRKDDMVAQGGIYIGGDSFDSAFMQKVLTPHFGKDLPYESVPGKMMEVPNVLFDNITSWEKMNFFNTHKLINDIDKYYFLTKYNPRLQALKTLIQNNLGYSVFREIEQTKITLSAADASHFLFSKEGIEIDEHITIDQYNTVIAPSINKIGKYLDDFLAKNHTAPHAIDSVFITGGSAQVRAIISMITNRFGTAKLRSGDYLNSVSHGLAWSYFGKTV